MHKQNYKNGKREGAWVAYVSDGQIWSKGNFKNGKRKSTWVVHRVDRTLYKLLTGTFKDGVKISD